MGNPKLGMDYADVSRRVRRMKQHEDKPGAKAMVSSLINQAKLREDEGAEKELISEYYDSCSSPRHGWAPKYAREYERIFNKGSA